MSAVPSLTDGERRLDRDVLSVRLDYPRHVRPHFLLPSAPLSRSNLFSPR